MLTLWYAPSTIALAVHIALEEVEAAHELRRLNFGEGEQRGADYLGVNAKGRVPTLHKPQGKLTETLAILTWIAETHLEADLLPSDPFDKARCLAAQTYLASTMHVAHAHKMRGSRWSDDPAAWESMKAKVPETMTDCATYIETEVLGAPWVMGAQYTVADPYLFTVCRWLKGDGVDLAAFPGISAHMAAMEARPAVQRALAHH